PEAWVATLSTWVDGGGAVVAVLQEKTSQGWRKLLPPELADPRRIEVREADAKVEFSLLSEIDLRHPLFAPLNDPRFPISPRSAFGDIGPSSSTAKPRRSCGFSPASTAARPP